MAAAPSWYAADDGTGSSYYANDQSGESQWELPDDPCVVESASLINLSFSNLAFGTLPGPHQLNAFPHLSGSSLLVGNLSVPLSLSGLASAGLRIAGGLLGSALLLLLHRRLLELFKADPTPTVSGHATRST